MLTETQFGILANAADAKITIFLKEPTLCKVCNRDVMILINDMGTTRCPTCPEPT